jgi:hypothetical protein
LWLGAGILVTLIGLLALTWFLERFLTQLPQEAAGSEPSIIQLTAPSQPTTAAAVNPPTPTVAPTATTAPTPDLSVAPPEVTVGYYAQVVGTGGVGVTVRNGPSTSNVLVLVAPEGSVLLVLEGPTPGGAYQWWRVRLADGAEGWVAGDFLVPAAAPQGATSG